MCEAGCGCGGSCAMLQCGQAVLRPVRVLLLQLIHSALHQSAGLMHLLLDMRGKLQTSMACCVSTSARGLPGLSRR